MKIALIGNMNNNNFALMRYFRDLGADAHLLLYTNDGTGSLEHFSPRSDTWEEQKWSPFIHQTQIPNAVISAFDFPMSWLLSTRSLFRHKLGLQDSRVGIVTRPQIRGAYEKYDKLIASGITPATCQRVGIRLDIFYPYAAAVEFLDSNVFVSKLKGSSFFNRKILKSVRKKQERGIQRARHILNAEVGLTELALVKRGIYPKRLAIPMVYNKESTLAQTPHASLSPILREIERTGLSILAHSRLMWKKAGAYSDAEWTLENKNNDRLLQAVKRLTELRPDLNLLLILLEYGPDVDATKKLCIELGIDSHVRWLPQMDRKWLLFLLDRVDVGVGEFYDVSKILWGGTGWEVLASGKPLLQGFNFTDGEFESIYGYPPPPMLPVRNQEDILMHLLDMSDHPAKRESIGTSASEWFNRHNGIGLASKWLDLVLA